MAEVYRIGDDGRSHYAGYVRYDRATGRVTYSGGGGRNNYGRVMQTAAARSSRNNALSRLQRRMRG